MLFGLLRGAGRAAQLYRRAVDIALQARSGEAALSAADAWASAFERSGLTEWNFGDLPAQIKFKRGGRELTGYPALVDSGDAVDLRLVEYQGAP